MKGTLTNELKIDFLINELKRFTNNGTDNNKLKNIGITRSGYEVYSNKEIVPPFSLAIRIANEANIELEKFYTFIS